MSTLSNHFEGKEYVRVFVKPEEEVNFVNSYIKNFDAKIEYIFDIEAIDVRVIALISDFTNISAVVIDDVKKLPDMLQRTKLLY